MASGQEQLYNKNWRLLECIKSNKPIAIRLIDLRRCLEQRADVNITDENENTPLHLAVRRVKAIIVKLLIKRGAKVNAKNVHGNTPLHDAVRFREISIVELLISKGADVNVHDGFKNTPLHVATQLGRTSTGKVLLDNGANIQAQNKDGNTPLHEAVRLDKIPFAYLLLNKGADINAKNKRGHTPLHVAAKLGLMSAVELLLNNGADLNSQDINNDTPLYLAVGSEMASVVELLLSKGADANAHDLYGTSALLDASCIEDPSIAEMLLNKGADVNVPGAFGFTPLHSAVNYGSLYVTKLLLDKGAHVNAQTVNGLTPLHLTARSGATAFAELLLSRGADVNAPRSDGYTPLHGAARSGEMPIVELLINKGADLNAQTLNRYTPLHAAARSGKISVVELLLNKGANVNARTKEGDMPLHGAARSKETSVVELLLNKGADVNAQGTSGYTPLHAAARFKDTSVVELLLKKGAKVNAQGLDGYTPLHVAAGAQETAVVELLLNMGANVNTQGTNGFSPLHIAVKCRLLLIVELLLNNGADANAQLTIGDKPLHLAVCSSDAAIMECLLEKGADVNAQDRDGDTPLHKAALFGEISVLEILLKWGADVNALARNDITPLHEAINSKKISIVELLLNNGANVNAQKTDGDTPLHEALLNEDTAIATLLVHHGADVMLRNRTGDTPMLYALLFSFKNKAQIVSLLQTAEKKAKDNALLNNHRPQISYYSSQSSNQDVVPNKTQHDNKKFKYLKTTDTSGAAGQLNETKVVSLVFIRVLNHEHIEHDIFLGSNIHGIGAMDDICLRYRVKGRQRPTVIFMQAKHREDTDKRKLTDKDLWSDTGDFNLRKYFKSYLMIREQFRIDNEDPMFEGDYTDVDCYFVLYTSAKDNITKKKTENKVCEILHDLINTGKHTNIGVFQYGYDENDIDRLIEVASEFRIQKSKGIVFPNLNFIEYDDKIQTKDFFSKLWFYSGQAKEDEIESIVKDEISIYYNNQKDANSYKFKIHSNAIFLKVHEEIQQWSKLRVEASYLNRSNDFFSRAKLECFDDVLHVVIKTMNNFKINLDFEYNQCVKQREMSTGTLKVFHTLLCRLFKIIDKESKSIRVNVDFNDEIANLLVSNKRLPNINVQSSDLSQAINQFYKSSNTELILYNDVRKNEQIKYSKRAGTSEIGGTLYRTKMLSLVYLRMLYHEEIAQDLMIGTKIRGVSFMSDICVRYKVKGQQKPVALFVQLIHREDTDKGRFTVEELWKDTGNFSLHKYFISYLEIKDQFQLGNKDLMFDGDFYDVDCYFFICTPVKENFTKKKTECQINKLLQDIISTKQNTKPFQYDYDEIDIDCLTKVIVMNRIEKLGTVFIKSMDLRKTEICKPNILVDKLIATYHVALRREVLQECKAQEPNKEYRMWEFRPEFFDSDLEHLTTLKRTFMKILSSKGGEQNNVNIELQKKKTNGDVREKLLRLKLKLPVAFGNLDMTFRGSDDKVQKRIKALADKLMYILELYKDTKIIDINENDVGQEKNIEHGTLSINGGIGSAVGNLLVFDKDSNMLKFELNSLPPNAASFLRGLEQDEYKPHNENLSSYRFRINVSGFPKDSFIAGDENDKSQAKEFLNTFWFYSDQAKEDEVECIIRDKINEIYSTNDIFSRNNSDLISLHYLDEIQKWWIQINESAYLSRASELFERAELADLYNLLQTVINYMYILNINSINIKVKRSNINEKYEHMHQMFKQISGKLLNLFDAQFNESIYFQLRGSTSEIFDKVSLSLRIDSEMKWVALILMAESGDDKYRIFAKACPSSGNRRAKDGFMIYEQNFNGPYCISTRNCLKNVFV